MSEIDTYLCTKCGYNHKLDSAIGKEHVEFAEAKTTEETVDITPTAEELAMTTPLEETPVEATVEEAQPVVAEEPAETPTEVAEVVEEEPEAVATDQVDETVVEEEPVAETEEEPEPTPDAPDIFYVQAPTLNRTFTCEGPQVEQELKLLTGRLAVGDTITVKRLS